ncbi:arsenic resistance protein [Hydrogenophaga sp.]|uniref:arsenic resistance protein n=1 Tax=Hydrogenophaga sp. TaxID=1904254 RepID=UPI002731CF0C|nr:bile acid:sodium symporter [Hydrogenophaga sp.]MDP2074812.1 bile acid:sodium symporter [Hydrogenophaga sp.]MDP3108911.1 bile acid:sodium symporter [Hydrogenophaga sp.]MDP3350101.1 bile acid:sodium symporter [Hydrogenophaga sp.]MDZ4399098.1 bile acid:sodium symporter [Hydrogenophaga sp.]
MNALLARLQKHLVWSIPGAMLLGLGFGSLTDASALRWSILPLTFLMVYPMMVTMNLRALAAPGGQRLQGVALVINFLVMPAIGWALGLLFFAEQPAARLALLLTALLPTSGMTISWTGFAKGNVAAAVQMTVIGLIAGSLLAPLYLKALLGAVVDIPMLQVALQIALIVFLPMALGHLTQKHLIKRHGQQRFNATLKPLFPPWSTLGVLGIVFVSMALKAPDILHSPQVLATLLWPLVLMYALNFTLSTLVGRALFQRGDAIALLYGTAMRNLSIALAIAIGVFREQGADAALLIALAYIVQVQAAAWSVRWTDRIFGTAPATPAPVTKA